MSRAVTVKSKLQPFNGAFSADDLQQELWAVLQKVKNKKIKPTEANAITMAAKEICSVARIKLQYKVLEGIENQGLTIK